jgi:hypothetical protein
MTKNDEETGGGDEPALLLFGAKEWENVAATAFSAFVKTTGVAEWARALGAYRKEFRRVAREVSDQKRAEMETRQRERDIAVTADALQYEHVVFDPSLRMSPGAKFWPDNMKVHQRRAGKLETMCGRLIKPVESKKRVQTLSSNPRGWLRKCRVCKALGGLQVRHRRVALVSQQETEKARAARVRRLTERAERNENER